MYYSWVTPTKDNAVPLNLKVIDKLCTLARIKLPSGEENDVIDKLTRIVELVDQLQAAETENVEPMAHPLRQAQRLREDKVTEKDEREELQKNAGNVKHHLYLVPKVIE